MPMMQDIGSYSSPCAICGANRWGVLYRGQIRMGKFGQWSENEHTIWKCKSCRAGFLPTASIDYETAEYRKMVDGDHSVEDYYVCHDKEQAARLAVLGTGNLRGRVVADVGCGAGSFLDLTKGFARETVAIEPCREYHQALGNKGHAVYSYAEDALQDYEGQVDIAVSFAVLEHVPDPLSFLKEIKQLLKPEGMLLLSTPNYDDWLIEFLPDVYDKFFFRAVHTWYFNGESLPTLGKLAGFQSIELSYKNRFDLSNALLWARDGQPTGTGKAPILSRLDGLFKKILEEQGRSDFIYAWLRPFKV
jgi:2-polyprenyl-3-methyl-5-hydroxy-6-metoxy-1,4-benzoquinol methylase